MEITKHNFNDQIETITEQILDSCFIGFDAEFSNLLTGKKFKNRLFDTNEDRYNLLKNHVGDIMITQIGLTLFKFNTFAESYVAHTYTFHLCPQTLGDIDQSCKFQASTLKFLCRHNFNYNKFLYEGIPYLSKVELEMLEQKLSDDTLFSYIKQGLDDAEMRLIQSYCSAITHWFLHTNEDSICLDVQNPLMRYIMHLEFRERYPELLTANILGDDNKIMVYRYEIEGAENTPKEKIENDFMAYITGFSKIICLIKTELKPVIGHNMFMDTVLLHNQFIGPLPQKYTVFKNNVSEVFPVLFDTKYISYVMKAKLTKDEQWQSNSLQDLYEFFSKGQCKKLELGINSIKLGTEFGPKQTYHEAGWDSYCAGYCFLRLGHWAHGESMGLYRLTSPMEKLSSLLQFRNKINVIRGAMSHMNLAEPDPAIGRPKILYLKPQKTREIDFNQVVYDLTDIGEVDIKPYGKKACLVAAQTHHIANRILQHYSFFKDYKITYFNAFRHSPLSKFAFWGSALITALYLLQKRI